MENFLNAQIGSQLRKVKIIDIKKENIQANDRESEKIVFTVFDDTVKREFKISDCWVETTNSLKISGLWYLANDDGVISPNSALAKVLSHYNQSALVNMLELEVMVNLKLWSTDDIVLLAIREKHSFESHKDDISYAGHHNGCWIRLDGDLNKVSDKTITLSQLKKIVDKQLKVK